MKTKGKWRFKCFLNTLTVVLSPGSGDNFERPGYENVLDFTNSNEYLL